MERRLNRGLVEHLKEYQRVVRLRHAALKSAWTGKEDSKERSFLAIERDAIVKRLEDRLLHEEIEELPERVP